MLITFVHNQSKTRFITMLHKLFTTALVAVAMIITISSCKKSDETTSTPAPAAGMTATVAGASWTASSTIFSDTANTLQITGISGTTQINSKSISLICPKAIGSYTLSGTTFDKGANYTEGATAYSTILSSIGSGTINITSLSSTNVKGTFSFTGTEFGGTASKTITNGSFNITK